MFPIPNQMGVWPNFRSPLLWDVFAVSVYGTVSALFWYVGLIPDLAMIRDRAKTRTRQFAYGFLALGWRGSVRQWHHYETAYLVLAALATPLVLSVHSVVSMDFAVSSVPGWHDNLPALLVAARFSGFAMVLTLHGDLPQGVPPRAHHHPPPSTIWRRSLLVTGTMVSYAYANEFFTLPYSGTLRGLHVPNRAMGPTPGLLDHGHLQRGQPPVLLVRAGAAPAYRSCSLCRSSSTSGCGSSGS
jgi:molybdopterin-containing oxidoreductase family membrane subunit